MAKRLTIPQRLSALAQHLVPHPFGKKLAEIANLSRQMRDEAAKLGIKRQFTPDGRFIGDVGEVIAELKCGIKLHDVQQGGQDGVCCVLGHSVEVKMRTASSPIWVTQIPDIFLVIYLCPLTLRWGIVYNGPGSCLNDSRYAVYNKSKARFETTVSKILQASDAMERGEIPAEPKLTISA